MKCAKCSKKNIAWESGKTYKGLDKHHNPPEFLSNKLGEEWSGEFYMLCRDCHVELHREIKQILFKNSNSMKFIDSEDWLMKKMCINQIKEAQKEIYDFTKEWINGNTKTT